jgi:hypothetical protein
MHEAEIYPLDVTELKRGEVIDAARCAGITRKEPGTDSYRLALLSLRKWIMDETHERGEPLSIAIEGDTLRVNTDAEASDYHARLCETGQAQVYRNLRHLQRTVRRAILSPDEQKQHDRRLLLWAQKVMRLRARGNGNGAIHGEAPKELPG